MKTIGFIGAGNIASSIIGGLIADAYPSHQIWASNPTTEKLARLQNQFGIHTCTDNKELTKQCDFIVIGVKPAIVNTVLQEIAPVLTPEKCIISIATGINTAALGKHFQTPQPIVRAMPNTPAMVRSAATGLFANSHVEQAQRDYAEKIFRSVGITLWLDEEQDINTITALSGSGPAYFFLFMEAMEEYGIAAGLSPNVAHLLTLQTGLGAIHLAMESKDSLETLRNRVTSKGGTTAAALAVFENQQFRETIHAALSAAQQRAERLEGEVK